MADRGTGFLPIVGNPYELLVIVGADFGLRSAARSSDADGAKREDPLPLDGGANELGIAKPRGDFVSLRLLKCYFERLPDVASENALTASSKLLFGCCAVPSNYTDPFWSNLGAGFSIVGGRSPRWPRPQMEPGMQAPLTAGFGAQPTRDST